MPGASEAFDSGGTNTVSSSLLVGAEGAQNGTSAAGGYALHEAGCPPPKKHRPLQRRWRLHAIGRDEFGRLADFCLLVQFAHHRRQRDVQSQRREAYRYVDRPRSGAAAFNFNGGTLQAGAAFSTTLPIGLNTSGGNAAIDSGGYAVTSRARFPGPGNLIKVTAARWP